MLRNADAVMGCAIGATDGEVGEVEDFYFDDREWTMRYLVVETGAWLKHRKVLISPCSLGPPEWDRKLLPASITIEQVRGSPDIDTNKPVSRQHESLFLSHYQYPRYWEEAGPSTVGPDLKVQSLDSQFGWSDAHFSKAVAARDRQNVEGVADNGQHLRSCTTVRKYSVRTHDADIGHVHGFLFEGDDWVIRYLVVQTGHWWLGHRILIAVQWITDVSWLDSCFDVDLSRQTLIEAPSYDPTKPLDRSKEIELFEYYGRAGYWHQSTVTGSRG